MIGATNETVQILAKKLLPLLKKKLLKNLTQYFSSNIGKISNDKRIQYLIVIKKKFIKIFLLIYYI